MSGLLVAFAWGLLIVAALGLLAIVAIALLYELVYLPRRHR